MSARRPYTCRGCGLERWEAGQPINWYSVRVSRPGKVLPLGVFCTLACLASVVRDGLEARS